MSRHLSFLTLTLLLLLSPTACAPGVEPTSDLGTAGNIDLSKAAQYFAEFKELCDQDAGHLWGVSFAGPILLVDPSTRSVVANQSDPGGLLQPRASVFVGKLPPDVGIANTASEWSGTRWTMLIWGSLREDRTRRLRLLIHEAFHRLQPELNLAPYGEINAHLDTAEGRYWIQLEWNALQRALTSEGDARREAIVDALSFRTARRAEFPKAAERERPLEIFEGLAEYSGMRLAGYTDSGVVDAVAAKREQETGFVRSFAYISGPLYGYLLDTRETAWRERVDADTDLGVLLAEALELSPGPATEAIGRAESYDGPTLLAAEREREGKRNEQLAAWRAALIEGPVLIVDLGGVESVTFDPGKVFPFDEGRTVYTIRGLIAEWGKLSVTDGAILEDETTMRGHISLIGASDDRLGGPGWELEPADGWRILPADRPGDFILREP